KHAPFIGGSGAYGVFSVVQGFRLLILDFVGSSVQHLFPVLAGLLLEFFFILLNPFFHSSRRRLVDTCNHWLLLRGGRRHDGNLRQIGVRAGLGICLVVHLERNTDAAILLHIL